MNIQDFYIKTVEPSKYVLAPGENDPFLEICVAEGICTAEGLTQEQADAVETFPPTNGADWGDAKEQLTDASPLQYFRNLKRIDGGAFYTTNIERIIIPQGCLEIGPARSVKPSL